MSWPTVALGECLERVANVDPARRFAAAKFTYVDLSSIDRDSKRILAPTPTIGIEAPSRARQVLATDDVLVSTVRPNLNAVACVDRDLDGSIGSTGFAVLRASELLDHRYLFHWVRSAGFVDRMVRLATGASYPAVSERNVRESLIPLPPIDEQRCISRVLDAVDSLRSKRDAIIATLEELVDSVFADMFVSNGGATWPAVAVGNLVDPDGAGIRTGPFGSQLLHSEFVDDGVAVLGIDNVVTNEFRWAKPRHINQTKYAALRRYTVHPGDVLITIMGTCGRAAVVPDDVPPAINTKHLCCITLDQRRCIPPFLHAYFLRHPTARSYLLGRAKGAVMSGLNMSIIKELPVQLPPLAVQREFASRSERIGDAKRLAVRHRHQLDVLFASLQHRAFTGAP